MCGKATAYGLLSYLTAYLKYYHPTEFFTALLTAKSDKPEKIASIISDCKHFGVEVLPPDINKSLKEFSANPSEKTILFGLSGVKDVGDGVVDNIINLRPYKSLKDYVDKVKDKTATISLIKAGAFGGVDKAALLKKYAVILYPQKSYKEVTSLPTAKTLRDEWGIEPMQYLEGKKVDKVKVLELYNSKRKDRFNAEERCRFSKYMNDFKEKYATDESLWEFKSLNTFLTSNPLQEGYDIINTQWDDVKDGDKAVVPCVIVNVKRKKDKNNKQFAYLDLCLNNKIIESTIWSKQLNDYFDLVQKGSCVVILGRKEDNHLFVEKVKPYKVWIEEKRRQIVGREI